MLRNILKHASSSKKLRFLSGPSLLPTSAFLGSSQNPIFPDKIRPFDLKPSVNFAFPEMGFYRNGELSPWDEERIKSSGAFFVRRCFGPKARSNFGIREMGFGQNGKLSSFGGYFKNPFGFCKHLNPAMGFASVAEAVSSTDADEEVSVVEEVGEFRQKQHKPPGGIGHGKLCALLRRQEKTEVEAWEQSVKEYKELLMDMCQQKLAPNLPYMKSLFLGWFEPLRNCIAKEQGLCREGKNKAAYAMYFDQLPADKMAVITMHTLMGLLMTGSEHGSARVVQAACQVGKAIENEVRIHKFLEKKTKKHNKEKSNGGEPDPVAKEQEIQSKRVTNLIKKQKLHQVRKIVKDDSKPWDQEAQAKIGSCLIELLISTAYIQPPVDQSADDPPDIRPAFRHSLKTVTREQQKVSRRYGVIECDPLVRKGLDRTVRHMVIPCMPMLVPPKNWIRYNKGAYLHLPSHVMRTHGARQRSEAMNCFNRAPKGQLQPVF